MQTMVNTMLNKHGLKMIKISTDKRFRCSSCYSGYDPTDTRSDCLECFGTSYKARISWMDVILVQPSRNVSDVEQVAGYENPRFFKAYVRTNEHMEMGDMVVEIDPINQTNLQSPVPPVAPLHIFMVHTAQAMYYDAKFVCYQCTFRVEDILLDPYTKLLAQL